MAKISPRLGGGITGIDVYDPGSTYTVTSGMPYRVDGTTLHDGTDYANVAGSPVYAMADGVVTKINLSHHNQNSTINNPNGFGMYIEVKSSRADQSTIEAKYGHVQAVDGLNEGASVKAGQLIGYIRDKDVLTSQGGQVSRFFSGPHLHLEIQDSVTDGPGRRNQENSLTFTRWESVSHMIGTNSSGNPIIATETGSLETGVWTRTIQVRDKATGVIDPNYIESPLIY